MKGQKVTFGGQLINLGTVGGLGVALGLPFIVLRWGTQLPGWFQGIIVVLAVLVGGGAVLVSAFFASVMPKVVEHYGEKTQEEEGQEVEKPVGPGTGE